MQKLQDSEIPTKSTSLSKRIITLDTETSGLDWKTSVIHLIGYRLDNKGDVIYVDPTRIDACLFDLLAAPGNVLRGHNVKFDALMLSAAGYDVACHLEDTRVLAYLNWPREDSHSLKSLVRTRLGRTPKELTDILFKPLKKELIHADAYREHYFEIDERWARKDFLIDYHKEDVLNVDRLRNIMVATKWFTEVEMPLTRVLFEMELYGCPLDLAHLNLLNLDYQARIDGLLKSLGASEDFNPNSAAQVGAELIKRGYDLEKLCKKTDKGAFQVDKQFLKKLAFKGDAFAKTLLEYRRLTKIVGTYITPFITGSSKDGRLHGSINQAGSEDKYGDGKKGTNTGRLSSSDPNLQNIPARTKEGKEVRRAFIASKGYQMFDSDLKQIEPRLVGHYSQSPKLIKAYKEGLDTHGLFASDIFGKPITQLSTTERFIGKTSWLATVYGCSHKKLLGICEIFSETPLVLELDKFQRVFDSMPAKCKAYYCQRRGKCWHDTKQSVLAEAGDEASARILAAKWAFFKKVQEEFKKKNPEIMDWCAAQIEKTRRDGYILTIGGRKIPFPDINSTDNATKAVAERRCINYQIQPSAADIMKLIMLEYNRRIIKTGKGRLFAVVHDELLGEFKKDLDHSKTIEEIKDIMCNTVKLNNVPIDSDTKLCSSWSDK